MFHRLPTTTKVGSITNNGNTVSYQYDKSGNIANIAKGTRGENLVKNSNFISGIANLGELALLIQMQYIQMLHIKM